MAVEQLHSTPHLTTALKGPLLELEQHLLERQAAIEAWFRGQWAQTPASLYASVDLRNAGFKLAPVDTNLFPAGFNNLNPEFMSLCVHALQAAIERYCPTAARVIVIPESHTRNQYYLASLNRLADILVTAGFDVRIGSLREDLDGPDTLHDIDGREITLHPLEREGNRVRVDDFDPCFVLLNNDLADGLPPILDDIEQTLLPPLVMGWSNRLKSQHFGYYEQVADEFARLVSIDPWTIAPIFRYCGEIDFMMREGEDCLVRNVGQVLEEVQAKYDAYGVDRPPFAVVKADAGTYGMAIMTVQNADEVRELNRKQRTRMAKGKGGQAVSRVIVQEGVYTFETWGEEQAVAEPVVYMIDRFVVGGFYRVHRGRGDNENLNSPGMEFEPLSFAMSCNTPDASKAPDANPNRFYAYGVIARLALLAAAREISHLT